MWPASTPNRPSSGRGDGASRPHVAALMFRERPRVIDTPMTLRLAWIRRVDPWSAAKVAGVLGALVGVIEGLLLLAALLLGGGLIASLSPEGDLAGMVGAGSVVVGVLVLFAAPLAGAALGFVVGGVGAVLANLALGFAGGLELELDLE